MPSYLIARMNQHNGKDRKRAHVHVYRVSAFAARYLNYLNESTTVRETPRKIGNADEREHDCQRDRRETPRKSGNVDGRMGGRVKQTRPAPVMAIYVLFDHPNSVLSRSAI